MAILQPLMDLAAICYEHGVRHVVISPGSRSAALTLAFARHEGFETHACMDERSAGFIALGIAQQLKVPVVLICTSGSAAYNFAPAVAEAFFQQIPLLILTADRPREWLHQLDGQTIYQAEIYGKHVKKSFDISPDYGHPDVVWAINRIANDALNTSIALPAGPVHINVPIREPFYPQQGEVYKQSESVRIVRQIAIEGDLRTEVWHELLEEWENSGRILIAGGQIDFDPELNKVLGQISEEWSIPVVGDCISNLHGAEFIHGHDLFLSVENASNLAPDLLITFGLSFISKDLKVFLRKYRPKQHWHIGIGPMLADPTQSLTNQIGMAPVKFFQNLFEQVDYQLFVQNSDPENDSEFGQIWRMRENYSKRLRSNYLQNITSINDLTSLDFVFKYIKTAFQLHVANSMSVRYTNALDLPESVTQVYANRGTSGIDGCVSTAIGAAIVNGVPTLLVVGDVAFLYDRNGLLINSLPSNLKIVVLNNAGGNIFRMIDGPSGLPEIEEFFETRHTFSARRTCEDSGIDYYAAHDLTQLANIITDFLGSQSTSLLEIFTDPYENERVWKGLRKLSRES